MTEAREWPAPESGRIAFDERRRAAHKQLQQLVTLMRKDAGVPQGVKVQYDVERGVFTEIGQERNDDEA